MLWYKSWLETRFRLVFALVGFLFLISVNSYGLVKLGKGASSPGQHFVLGAQALYCLIPALFLAGTGVDTQSSFRPVRGLHGSTLFTLSLPVSRLRLLVVRSTLGIAELFALITAVYTAVWFSFPALRAEWPTRDRLDYLLTIFVCLLTFYFLFVAISALVRDDFARNWICMGTAGALWWLLARPRVPRFLNLLGAMGADSPLFTHSLPWTTMGVSIGASAILFCVAVKMVQSREY